MINSLLTIMRYYEIDSADLVQALKKTKWSPIDDELERRRQALEDRRAGNTLNSDIVYPGATQVKPGIWIADKSTSIFAPGTYRLTFPFKPDTKA